MFESIKKNIANRIILHRAKNFRHKGQSFRNIFQNSHSFFIMMPENQDDFKGAVNIIKDFEAGGKTATIFTRDFLVARLPQKFQKYAITFGMDELTRLYLPSKKLRDKLAAADYDAVLDLNREENIFFSYLSNLVNSPLRAGIIKPGADKFYNLQIENSKDAPEIFYKNFLNCLQMF